MLNLRARQYEPGMMRFEQRDLLKGDQSAPLSLNRYLYCENDSVNFVDPSGKSLSDLWNKAKTAVSNGVAAVKKVAAAAKNVVSAAKENTKSFITEAKTKISNSVAEAKAEVKSGIIKTAAKITSAATTFANNVKTTVSNTRTSVLDWYGRNEETINKCLTTAAVVLGTVAFVALTVASAGAVAAAAGVMFAGTALAGSAATLATLGVYGLATVTALFGANNVGEIWSGYNVIRDTVFGGNQMAYDYAQAGLAVLNMGVMQFGSYNSGLLRTPSTSDDPADETVGASAGEYAGRQAEGATQSGSAGTTACTEVNNSFTNQEGEIFSPINPGPLSDDVANSFRSATYVEKVLTEDTVFYRVYGGDAQMAGNYMSRTPQNGGMQSQIDLGLNPIWGNTTENIVKVTVPKGTIIYEGSAASQGINGGAGNLLGGGNQIYIPEARLNIPWFGN